MKIVATTSLPAVDRPNADCWNAARSRQMFVSLSNLETHKNFDHSSVSSFPCKKCSFAFQSKAEFDEHLSGMEHNMPMKVPDDTDNEYDDEHFVKICNFCGLIFNLFEDLDHHHSNYLRCYSCKICYHNEFQFKKHEIKLRSFYGKEKCTFTCTI